MENPAGAFIKVDIESGKIVGIFSHGKTDAECVKIQQILKNHGLLALDALNRDDQ